MSETSAPPETIAIAVDGKEILAKPGELVIEACERAGIYIPRFCYHPRMRPVGMCRMCIVEIDTGRGPALQPSCMIPAAAEMKVATRSEATIKAQDGVLEFLLINHPLDCPVCDKGGECPLQDQTLAYGPGESRFIEEKRHFEKPIAISETVFLDRERCILCDRCTRFAKDVAGDPLIHFIDRGNETQVNTFPDHPFASYFSGNTVQICPVGALTAKPYRFRARPWDLEQSESTCQSCAVGCRIVIDSSRNRVLRYNGVDIDPVNWGWLCDKGRFDFESVQHPDRLTGPQLRSDTGGELADARWSEALTAAGVALRAGLDRSGPGGVAVLGGARLTNESAYAWAKLAKGVIGTDHVDAQMGDGLPAASVLGLPRATIDDVCTPGATVLVLGPDLKEELPVLFLRLRHAIVEDGVRVVELSHAGTGLTDLATVSLRYRPGDVVDTLAALLAVGRAPVGADADAFGRAVDLLGDGPFTVVLGRASLAESADTVVAAAAALLDARPDVRFLLALRRGNVHGALDMGLAPGLLPGRTTLADGRDWFLTAWDTAPEVPGLDAAGILVAAAEGRIDTLVLVGADPMADFPDRHLAARALAGARTVIACDLFMTESAARADVVLPAAGFAEVSGTTTNMEGRVSLLAQAVTPPGTARPDWMIASELAWRLGADLRLESVEQIWEEIEELAPSHDGISLHLLRSPGAADGVLAPLTAGSITATEVNIEGTAIGGTDVSITGDQTSAEAKEAHGEAAAAAAEGEAADTPEASDAAVTEAAGHSARAAAAEDRAADDDTDADRPAASSGGDASASTPGTKPAPLRFNAPVGAPAVAVLDAYSLRLATTRKLYDAGTLLQHSPSIAGLAGTTGVRISPYDFGRLGIEIGATIRAITSRGVQQVEVEPDPSVPRGSAVVGFNLFGAAAAEMIDASRPVTEIRLETL